MEYLKKLDIVFEQVRLMEVEKDKELIRKLRDPKYMSMIRMEQELAMGNRIIREASIEPKPSFMDDEFDVFDLDSPVGRYNYKKCMKRLKIRIREWQCYICHCNVDIGITIEEHQNDREHHEKKMRLSEKMRNVLITKQYEAAALDKSIENERILSDSDVEENIDTSIEKKSTSKKRTFDDLNNDEITEKNDEITEKNDEISTIIPDAFENKCKKMK